MWFRLTVNAVFEADNVDDAFVKLSEHFNLNKKDKDVPVFLYGYVDIELLRKKGGK